MFSADDLSHSIGKTRKIIAVIDDGFYKSIKKHLGGEENEGKRDS